MRLLDLEGGQRTEVTQPFASDLIPRPTEPPKLVIKVVDPLMQGVPLSPGLGQPGICVPGERAYDSTQIADEGHCFLLHNCGLRGKTSVVVG